MLNYRIAHMEHEAARLDTLERSLAELQKRYDQVQHMLGASAEAFPAAAGDTLHRARSARASRTNADQAGSPNLAPTLAPTGETTDSTVAPAPSKSADPMD
jgi:hypothetical protein